MRITPALPWHLPQMARILWAFNRAVPWLPRVRSRMEDLRIFLGLMRRGLVRVARDRDGVAAFIVREGNLIHALYVHPERRRQGVGRALLAQAKAETNELRLWVLEANQPARAFYAAQGFEEATRGLGQGNDEGLPDVLMIWHARPREAE